MYLINGEQSKNIDTTGIFGKVISPYEGNTFQDS